MKHRIVYENMKNRIQDLDRHITSILKSKTEEDSISILTDRAIPVWVGSNVKNTLVMYLKSCEFDIILETLTFVTSAISENETCSISIYAFVLKSNLTFKLFIKAVYFF